jgi:hypothetical protein
MANTALGKADHLEREVIELRQRLTQPVAPVEPPKAKTIRSSKLETIIAKVNAGESITAEEIPLLIEGTVEQAEIVAKETVEAQRRQDRNEVDSWNRVDTYMTQNHPESMKFVTEMNLFKATNPEVGAIYNRLLSGGSEDDKIAATAFVWREYERANPHVRQVPVDPAKQAEEQQLLAQAVVRKEEVDKARRDAGLLGTQAGGVHETSAVQTGPSREEIDAAGRMMRNTGDGTLWRQLTIGKDLNHPLFNDL